MERLYRPAALFLSAMTLSVTPVRAGEIECIGYRNYLRELASVPTPGRAYGATVAGPHVYVATAEGLAVFALDGLAATSVPVGRVDLPGESRQVAISEGRAYVAAKLGGLHIVDVSNPASPVLLNTVPLPDEAWDVAVSEGYAYVADWYVGGLKVVEVSDPGHPQIVATRTVGGFARGIALKRNLAFLAVAGAGYQPKLVIFDISNPASPTQLALLHPDENAIADVEVAGRYAYLAHGPAGVTIVDVWYPAAPRVVGRVDTPGYAHRIALSGHHAFIADGFESGMWAVDVSNPAAPMVSGSSGSVDAWGIAAHDGRAYLADGRHGLTVIDVSAPAAPSVVASLDMPYLSGRIVLSGDRAYTTQAIETETGDFLWALQAVDISNLAAPQLSGSLMLPAAGFLATDGDFVYVTGVYEGGFHVVDISAPDTPVLRGSISTPGESWELAERGSHCFVAGWDNGLYVIDVSDPDAPTLVSTLDLAGAVDIRVKGDFAYVSMIEGPEALAVVDISDPTAPHVAGTLVAEGDFWGVAVNGNYVYLSGEVEDGELPSPILLVVDVRDAAHPEETRRIPLPWSTGYLATDGRTLYAAGLFGVMVLDQSNPPAPRVIGQISQWKYGGGIAVHPEALFHTRWAWPDPTGGYYFEVLGKQCPRLPSAEPEIESIATGSGLRTTPNPSQGEVRFELDSSEPGKVEVTLYDVLGRRVRSLKEAGARSGSAPVLWDGTDDWGRSLPNGVYFARARDASGSHVERVVLLR